MGIEVAGTRPPRCVLANVASGESLVCMFNPTSFTEKVQVNWNRVSVPGLSHQLLQFLSTGNRQLPGVEFYVDRFFARAEGDSSDILEFRGFLRALTVPPKAAVGVATTAPPRLLFIWPQVITIETVVTDLELAYRQFAADGSVLVYAATVTFEEVLDARVTSEQRREDL